MKRRYRTVDVFTGRAFGGNPLAVVLDADGLSTETMQAIAAEFGYSETTFVLPPPAPGVDAHVRIFTPSVELPFAGHPNIGTAFVLASLAGTAPPHLVFREGAGDVTVTLQYRNGVVTGAELLAPLPFAQAGTVAPSAAAACLSLPEHAIRRARHAPVVASVGLPFLFVELDSPDSLALAAPSLAAHRDVLLPAGTDGVMAYVADGTNITARMFAPLGGVAEDPATGSAVAALVGLLATCAGAPNLNIRVQQGAAIGRPSLLLARSETAAAGRISYVAGSCVGMMQGVLTLEEAA